MTPPTKKPRRRPVLKRSQGQPDTTHLSTDCTLTSKKYANALRDQSSNGHQPKIRDSKYRREWCMSEISVKTRGFGA
jgi:hypothetical protein